MTDPVSGGICKASAQMMQELQKSMEQNQGVAGNKGAGQFNDVMAQQGVQNPTQVNPAMDPSKVDELGYAIGKEIQVVIADPVAIEQAINRHYGDEDQDVAGILQHTHRPV